MSGCHHGMVEGRGCAHLKLGTFGRLFPELEPLFSHDSLLEALGRSGGSMDGDRTPDSNIPAGYTFFAQFVDHDVTLDTKTKLHSDQVQGPNTVPNVRSASLDLDCVYGFGPEASAHLYDGSTEKDITGTAANPNRRSLAFRNLLRGRSLGLPSGQAVAEALANCGYPIEPELLSLPPRRFPGVGDLSAKGKKALQQETPLFFCVLAEGGDNDHLGPTGSAILMEVFGGMLTSCKGTFLQDLSRSPDTNIVSSDHDLTLGDIARYVTA